MNRTNSIIKKRMRQAGKTENRPEQLLAKKLIDALLKANNQRVDSHLEYKVIDIKQADEVKLNFVPKIDIAYFFNRRKVAVELMGPPHETDRQKAKDDIKFTVLAHKTNGWDIIKFWHASFRFLFTRNERKLTRFELDLASLEIWLKLKKIFNLTNQLSQKELDVIFNEQ